MARAKVKLADNIARVVFIETEATIGATLGKDLKLPNGQVATAETLRAYLGVSTNQNGQQATHHRLLQGLNLGDDHPQYTRKDTLTEQGDLYVRGLTTVARLPVGTVGQILRSNGTAPAWTTVSPVITLGTDLTGSVTLTALGNGTLNATIANNVVSNAKLRDSAGLSVIGRSAGTTGDPADIVAANDLEVLRRSGGTLGFGALDSTFISDFAEATQDAVAGILTDSDTIDWVYDDALNTISAEVTIPPLTEEVAPDGSTDFVMVYSASAGGNVKVLLNNLPGGGGGGGSLAYVNTSVPSGNTVANTVSETAFDSAYTIPANSLQAGSVINIKAAGVYSTNATPPTIRVRVKLGATTILDSGVVTLSAVTDAGWWLDGQAAIFTGGASGTLDAQGLVVLNTGSGASLAVNLENTSSISVDTTAAQAATITVEWGTADADNTITLRQLAIWLADALDPIKKTFTRGATFVSPTEVSAPTNDVPVRIPIDCVISKVSVLTTNGPGNCVIDIRKDSYANFPPTGADSICAGAKPTITAGIKYEDSALVGWTKTVSAGDVLMFHLESADTFRTIAVTLELEPT